MVGSYDTTEKMRQANAEKIKGITEADLTAGKAKEILKDGEVQGEPLNDEQKEFFGAVAGGATPRKN